MAWYPIGPSSYPDLFGQTQYVNAKRIADQFLSMKRDFDAMKIAAGSGDRLSPNEARRTRTRQDVVWDIYMRNGYPKAALRYTSRHDEVTHGNAIDVGVTMANGQNRALTPAEFDWMHTNAERRGFTWTGRDFNEPWHIEGATRAEVLPPYPDIIAGAAPTPPSPEGATAPDFSNLQEDEVIPIVGTPRGIKVLNILDNTYYDITKGGLTAREGIAKKDFLVATGAAKFIDKQANAVLRGFKEIK